MINVPKGILLWENWDMNQIYSTELDLTLFLGIYLTTAVIGDNSYP